jgi:hypothetical protein
VAAAKMSSEFWAKFEPVWKFGQPLAICDFRYRRQGGTEMDSKISLNERKIRCGN